MVVSDGWVVVTDGSVVVTDGWVVVTDGSVVVGVKSTFGTIRAAKNLLGTFSFWGKVFQESFNFFRKKIFSLRLLSAS